ncbi:TPA: hypothetical protein DIS56_00430 [Candidatus Saccharibacteria bacterium]|nr:MAG: hypothetical protein A3F05_02025 [Candidatus Saccharibacteria bacterium RIFCSPHIGHO2_12_FULL_47_17]HCM51591.1 hypothetical protein [Candidatus Saccharibacteria bacterium]
MTEQKDDPKTNIHSRRVERLGSDTLGLAGIVNPPGTVSFDSTEATQAAMRVIEGIEPSKPPEGYRRADRPSKRDKAIQAVEDKSPSS